MDQRRSFNVRGPRIPTRSRTRLAAPTLLVVLLLPAAACGSSVSVASSPSPSVTTSATTSVSPTTDTSAGTSASPTTSASPSASASPSSSASALSAEQQVLADYFAAVEPVYEEFMSGWIGGSRAWKHAHKTMDRTWAVAADMLTEPLAQMTVARRTYPDVVPIPAALIAANTILGRGMKNVQTWFTMLRKGYAGGIDMDNDTAYGRKMGRLAKLYERQYETWRDAVEEQSGLLGVPIPWTWLED